jgi:hypothetical protein
VFAADGSYTWSHSDVVDTGTYGCTGLALDITPRFGEVIAASVDPETSNVTWEGQVYVPDP